MTIHNTILPSVISTRLAAFFPLPLEPLGVAIDGLARLLQFGLGRVVVIASLVVDTLLVGGVGAEDGACLDTLSTGNTALRPLSRLVNVLDVFIQRSGKTNTSLHFHLEHVGTTTGWWVLLSTGRWLLGVPTMRRQSSLFGTWRLCLRHSRLGSTRRSGGFRSMSSFRFRFWWLKVFEWVWFWGSTPVSIPVIQGFYLRNHKTQITLVFMSHLLMISHFNRHSLIVYFRASCGQTGQMRNKLWLRETVSNL